MLKKLEIVIIVMIFLLGIAQSNVRAVENDILLQIVSDNGKERYSTDGNVSVSKKIINNNREQGMISIETTISNKSKDTVQTKYEAIEVFFVLEEEAATGESSYSQYLQYVPMIANAILPTFFHFLSFTTYVVLSDTRSITVTLPSLAIIIS